MSLKENKVLLTGIALAAIDALMLATVGLFAKLLSEYFGPSEVIFLRNASGLLLLTSWFVFSRNLKSLKTKRPFAHIIRGTIGTIGIVIGAAALAMMPIAETTVLFLTSPLFVVILSYPVLREPVRLYEVLAVCIGFSGIIVMINPASDVNALPTLGIVLGLLWGFSAACVNVCLRWMGQTEHPTRSVFYFFLFGLIMTGFHWPFAKLPEGGFSLDMIWIVAGIGTASLCTQLAKAQSYRTVKATVIAPFIYSMIIWAMIFDYIFWDKPPGINVIIGAGLIVSSNIYILYKKSKTQTNTPEQ